MSSYQLLSGDRLAKRAWSEDESDSSTESEDYTSSKPPRIIRRRKASFNEDAHSLGSKKKKPLPANAWHHTAPRCRLCVPFFDNWREVKSAAKTAYLHHSSEQLFFTVATSGECSICALFLSGGLTVKPWSAIEPPQFVLNRLETTYNPCTMGLILVNPHRLGSYVMTLVIPQRNGTGFADGSNPLCLTYTVLAQVASSPALLYENAGTWSNSTRDGLHMVKKWLQDCSISDDCVRTKQCRSPTRLIELMEKGERLYLTKENDNNLRYATLSHCWGKRSYKTLLSTNLSGFQVKIPTSAISLTFQDAFEVARYLGYRYLWIDCLCIVQDDEDDWARESAMMCTIYGNSNLNIAASSASDGSMGCFVARHNKWRCQVRAGPDILDIYSPSLKSTLRSSNLAARGWVLQERILSPRTIHFTEKQIFWECNRHIACEALPDGVWDEAEYRKPLVNGSHKVGDWQSIVEAYSYAKLTFSKDKLVAISGLAQLVHSTSKDQYVAGLWKRDLIRQLLWRVNEPRTSQKYTDYIAPSWSWASVATYPKGLTFVRRIGDDWAEYIDIQLIDIKLKAADPFGALTSARMRISCQYIIPATISLPALDRETLGELPCARIGKGKWIDPIHITLDHSARMEFTILDVYLVPVSSDRQCLDTGLLLVAKGSGTFERIGLFSINVHDSPEYQYVLNTGDGLILERECVTTDLVNGKREYLIDLI